MLGPTLYISRDSPRSKACRSSFLHYFTRNIGFCRFVSFTPVATAKFFDDIEYPISFTRKMLRHCPVDTSWLMFMYTADCGAATGERQQRHGKTTSQTTTQCPPINRCEGHQQRRAFEVGQEPVQHCGARQIRSEGRRSEARRGVVGHFGAGRRHGG